MATDTDITCTDVTHKYGQKEATVTALQSVSLNVEKGSIYSIVGPSGCGKSTLLRLLLNLETPTSGQVWLNDDRKAKGISYIPQKTNLLPWRTAIQNASLGLELKDSIARPNVEFLKGEFRRYGLENFENTRWENLSGGMQQKVAIICALAKKPGILICDEPFSAIDFVSRLSLLTQFKNDCLFSHVTVVFVTHNIEEAIFLGSKVAVFSRRPGRLVREHEVDLGDSGYDSVSCRNSKIFQDLFHTIWRDLQEN